MNRREQIVRAAYEIAGREGLEAVHARTVAQAVGVNHAAVHYYFPKRCDLLLALLEGLRQRLEEDRTKVGALDGSDEDQLEGELALVEAYCRPESRFLKVLASLFVASIEMEELRAPLTDFLTSWRDRLAKLLSSRARKRGSLASNPTFVLACFLGMAWIAQAAPEAIEPTSTIDSLFDSLTKA